MASDPFGMLIVDVVKYLSGDYFDQTLYDLAYNLGKWIYLIDALDDFDKDVKTKNFNVLVNCYNDCLTKQQLLKVHYDDLTQVFGQVLFQIEECSKNLNYKFNHDLISNILVLGLRQQTKMIMENSKCKNTTKF